MNCSFLYLECGVFFPSNDRKVIKTQILVEYDVACYTFTTGTSDFQILTTALPVYLDFKVLDLRSMLDHFEHLKQKQS